MLVAIYGVSCVGKSTIIEMLVKNYSFKLIDVYTNREERINDFGRICISNQKYQELEKRKFFHSSNVNYKYLYGTPKENLLKAICDKNNYHILDYSINNYLQLEEFSPINILLLPKDFNQLKEQLKEEKRCERYSSVSSEIDSLYSNEKLDYYLSKNFILIENNPESINETSTKVYEATTKASS